VKDCEFLGSKRASRPKLSREEKLEFSFESMGLFFGWFTIQLRFRFRELCDLCNGIFYDISLCPWMEFTRWKLRVNVLFREGSKNLAFGSWAFGCSGG